MSWLRLVTVCIIVYLVGFLFDQPGMGLFWFLCKSTLSAIIVVAALFLNSKVSMTIAVLETVFIGCTLIAALQYEIGFAGNIYQHYEQILTATAIAEFLLLIWGAPWVGIYRLVESLGTAIAHRLSAGWLRAARWIKNPGLVPTQVQAK